MKRFAWLTDIHLNFISAEEVASFARQLQLESPDAVFVGGDIGEANSFEGFLRQMADLLVAPIYFVLGNHDFYHGAIAEVRHAAEALSRDATCLHWLPHAGVVRLTDHTTLVGHGGWGDGRIGDFLQSDVLLTDYALIRDLRETHAPDGLPPESIITPRLLEKLNSLGDEAALHFRNVLPEALHESQHVLLLTHVPPFHEACWHKGQLADDNWSPHFTCQAVGDVLVEFMQQHLDRKMTVLCGHTHSCGHARILDNLEVFSGEAKYGRPTVQRILEVQ